jgi:hypothetical protein
MLGKNVMYLNNATVNQAVEQYLQSQGLKDIKVTAVERDGLNNVPMFAVSFEAVVATEAPVG